MTRQTNRQPEEHRLAADATHPGTIDVLLQRRAVDLPFLVQEVRLKGPGHETLVRPDTPGPLHDTVVSRIARLLDSHLTTRRASAVLSRSIYGVTLPGLRLTGLRLLTRSRKDGSATATVRFLKAEGDQAAILKPHLRGAAPHHPTIVETALPVLRDLLCPALEVFDHILAHGLSEADARVLAARLKTMRARRDELSDYVELLTGALLSGEGRASPPEDTRTERIELPTTPHDMPVRSISWSPSGGTVRGEQASILHGHHARI